MSKWNKMKSIPLGVDILVCYPNGEVTEATASKQNSSNKKEKAYIMPIRLESHGCGCCADKNPFPIAWKYKSKPPKWMEKQS